MDKFPFRTACRYVTAPGNDTSHRTAKNASPAMLLNIDSAPCDL